MFQIEIVWSDDDFARSGSFVAGVADELAKSPRFQSPGGREVEIVSLERFSDPVEVVRYLEDHWSPNSPGPFRVWIIDLEYDGSTRPGMDHVKRVFNDANLVTDGWIIVSQRAAEMLQELKAFGANRVVPKQMSSQASPASSTLLPVREMNGGTLPRGRLPITRIFTYKPQADQLREVLKEMVDGSKHAGA